MPPAPRTPLGTEIKWCLWLLLPAALVAIAGFAMFLNGMRAL